MARPSRADMEAALAFAAEVGSAASQSDRADLWVLEQISRMIGIGSRTAALARTGRSLAASVPPESDAGIRGPA